MPNNKKDEEAKPLIYVSFDPADIKYLQTFEAQMTPALRHLDMQLWHRKKILPGARWVHEMAIHMEQCVLFVMLLSAESLASHDCTIETTALPKLRQSNPSVQTVSVLLRPCGWEYSAYYSFPMFPQRIGRDGSRLAVSGYANQSQAWDEVAKGIISLVAPKQLP